MIRRLLLVITIISTCWVKLTSQEIVIQDGHAHDITAIASDEDEFITVDANGKLVVWDLHTRLMKSAHQIGNIPYATIHMQRLQYYPETKMVLFNMHDFFNFKRTDYNKSMVLYNLEKDEVVQRLFQEADLLYKSGLGTYIYSNTFNQNPDYEFAFFRYSGVAVNDLDQTNKGYLEFDERITNFAVSDDGKYIGVGFESGKISVIDAEKFEILWEEKDFEGSILTLCFVEGQNHIAYTANISNIEKYPTNKIEIRDVQSGKSVKTLKADNNSNNFKKVICSDDGSYLASYSGTDLYVWDTKDYSKYDQESAFFVLNNTLNTSIADIAFIKNSRNIIVAAEQALSIYDMEYKSLGHNMNNAAVNFTGDLDLMNDYTYYLYGNDNQLNIYDLTKFERKTYDYNFFRLLTGEYTPGKESNSYEFSPYSGEIRSSLQPDNASMLVMSNSKKNKNSRNYYFNEFKIGSWEHPGGVGPFTWDEKDREDYLHPVYLNMDHEILIMNSIPGYNDFNLMSRYNIIHTSTNKKLHEFSARQYVFGGCRISPTGRYFACIEDPSSQLVVFDLHQLKEVYRVSIDPGANAVPYLFKEDKLCYVNQVAVDSTYISPVLEVDLETGATDTLFVLYNNNPSCFDIKGDTIAVGLSYDYTLDKWKDSVDYRIETFGFEYMVDYNLVLINYEKDEIIAKIPGNISFFSRIVLGKSYMITQQFGSEIQIIPYNDHSKEVKHLVFGNEDIFYSSKSYKASKKALPYIGLIYNNRCFPVDNLDIKYNRPHKIMSSLGIADASLIELYEKAYLKRMQRNTKDVADEESYFDMAKKPVVTIQNRDQIRTTTNDPTLKLDLQLSDSIYGVEKVQAVINGVPVFKEGGISVSTHPGQQQQKEILCRLVNGRNKIRLFAVNKNGLQSLSEFIDIEYQAVEEYTPDLYVISIGVSNYQDSTYNLKYASKDASDIQKLFSKYDTTYIYDQISVYQNFLFPDDYFNEVENIKVLNYNAQKDEILKLKDILNNTHEEDIVMVFLAGHGMLDENNDYYFATYDIDFNNPSGRGISFTELIALFDGIPSRKRVLFMDTCHSGELDDTDTGDQSPAEPVVVIADKNIVTNTKRGAKVLNTVEQKSLDNSFELMKSLFADINQSGTIVISASSGTGYALEDVKWQNGVFTYAILKGLGEKKADGNNDFTITISELKDFVLQEVEILTQGRQVPTVREENLEHDFRIW